MLGALCFALLQGFQRPVDSPRKRALPARASRQGAERTRAELKGFERELGRAHVFGPEAVPANVMNSRGELLDLDTGERMEFTLVFPSEANIDQGKISVLAPLGTAMLGYRVGDKFDWTVPYGLRRLKMTIVHLQPEAALARAA
jgi:regulator of nucleoside diphosphate kinase